MAGDKTIRCDCGYAVQAATEERRVAEMRAHAWEAHHVSFSIDEALGVLLRLELGRSESAVQAMEDTTPSKEDG